MARQPNRQRVLSALYDLFSSGEYKPGERLPSFPKLADRLETSVSVIQAVMPVFVANGTIEIIPKVGTIFRQRPSHSSASHGKRESRLRFFLSEPAATASFAWRKLFNQYEELHPGTCIDITLSDAEPRYIKSPDLLLVEHRLSGPRRQRGRCINWIDEDLRRAISGFAYFPRLLIEQTAGMCTLPVQFGVQVLFSKRILPKSMPVQFDDLLKMANSTGSPGLVLSNLTTPLWSCGMGSTDYLQYDTNTKSYLTAIACVPPPILLTPEDLVNPDPLTYMSSRECDQPEFVLGPLWLARLTMGTKWNICEPPGTGPIECSAMSLMIPEGPNETAAIDLGRYIVSPVGQQILRENDVLIPSSVNDSISDAHQVLLSAIERRGVPRRTLHWDDEWERRRHDLESSIASLRSHRCTLSSVLAQFAQLSS